MPRKVSRSVEQNLPLYRGEDYTGRSFGYWIVIGFDSYRPNAKRTSGSYRWKCRCQCGVEKTVVTTTLLYGRSNGCMSCTGNRGSAENNPNWKGYGEIPGEVMNRLRASCKRARLLELDVDCEYLDVLWKTQKRRCFYSGRPLEIMKTASLDRIDSSRGYVKGNVQWVHVDVNRAKWEMSSDEFIDLCCEVAEHNAQ